MSSTCLKFFTIALAAVWLAAGTTASATTIAYSSLASWQAAVDAVSDDTRPVVFDGFAHRTEIGSAELGPGVVFRPYQGTSTFPRVDSDSP